MMTNKEKFKETFGFAPSEGELHEVCPDHFDCTEIPNCSACPFSEEWWDREYMSCFQLKENENGLS